MFLPKKDAYVRVGLASPGQVRFSKAFWICGNTENGTAITLTMVKANTVFIAVIKGGRNLEGIRTTVAGKTVRELPQSR